MSITFGAAPPFRGSYITIIDGTKTSLRREAEEDRREMTNEALAQVERLIADCRKRIERQREVVANAFQKRHETEVAVSMLRA
jgi:hypothetical protein